MQPNDITGDPAACQYTTDTDETDDPEPSCLPGDEVSNEQLVEAHDLLGEIIVTHTSKEQLKVDSIVKILVTSCLCNFATSV